ncbi:MAG: YkgJ family cysteine cluster protein [Proteobacteria bacterium]|nr:YkgJ family cysteine cluster protein [Pseudomonadota bacterium]
MTQDRLENPNNPQEEEQFSLRPIEEGAKFPFSCHPGVPCFNVCCKQIDVLLTPFDVVRIKNTLGIQSDEFLVKYAEMQTFKGTELPLLKVKMNAEEQCVFLGEKGCTIYENRPVVCRNYPTGVATKKPDEEAGKNSFFIIEEKMCKGHFEKDQWTVHEYKENQGVTELDKQNHVWLEIVARLKSMGLKNDQDQKMNIFIMVSYDLDSFRSFVFNSSFLNRFDIKDDVVNKIKSDDEELLKFGFEWLKFALFAEGPIHPRK